MYVIPESGRRAKNTWYGTIIIEDVVMRRDDPSLSYGQRAPTAELYDDEGFLVASFHGPESRNKALGYGLLAKGAGLVGKFFSIREGGGPMEKF